MLFSGNIIISVLPPISTEGMSVSDVNDLMEQSHKLMSEEFSKISAAAQEGKNLNWANLFYFLNY